VDLARAAAQEMAGAACVGAHLEVQVDGDRVVTHLFECLDPAYLGWRWAVTVARASRAKLVTVDESVLLPGPDALLAPEWVPWRDRLQPGDLGVGDLLPAPADDERLVPVAALEGDDGVSSWAGDGTWDWADAGWGAGSAVTGSPEDDPEREPQLAGARARVLSMIGRDMTAVRWYSTDHGPRTPLAHAAPATCASCGFLVRLGGPLGRVFGVCANGWAPDDGRVVSVDHGCGAHSEGATAQASAQAVPPIINELGYDLVDMPGVSIDETVFEPFDHAG
jgi:hypothetical protein